MSDFDKDSDSDGCTRCGNIPSQSNAFKHLPEPTIQALSSFNTYSSTQREQIASAVTRIKEEQSKVDDVIDRTQAYLKHLLSEREMLSSALYKQQFLLSSIRNLPDEILSEVFLCLWRWGCCFAVHQPPLLLMHVCRRWRVLATSIQALWSHIHLFERFPPIWLLNEFLTRSRGYPLTINLQCGYSQIMGRTLLYPILTILFDHKSRWRTIEFALTSDVWNKIGTISPAARIFPMLQSVRLTVIGGFYGNPWKIFDNAPSLRDATVQCRGDHGIQFILPLCQLRSYKLWRSPVGYILRSFEQCPDLISCVVECISEGESKPTKTHQRMGQLEKLELLATRQSYFPLIFDFISTPALKDLTLTAGIGFKESAPISLIPFLVGSSCNLEKLTLYGLTLAGSELINILRHLPYLTELIVAQRRECLETPDLFTFTEEVFHSLARTTLADDGAQDHPIMVPRLRILRFTGRMDVSDQILLNLMQSRIELEADNPTVRFKTALLEIWRYPGATTLGSDVKNKVALWQKQGLDVKIQVHELTA